MSFLQLSIQLLYSSVKGQLSFYYIEHGSQLLDFNVWKTVEKKLLILTSSYDMPIAYAYYTKVTLIPFLPLLGILYLFYVYLDLYTISCILNENF